MHTAGRTPDVAYVVAPATATEHGQPSGNIVVCGLAAWHLSGLFQIKDLCTIICAMLPQIKVMHPCLSMLRLRAVSRLLHRNVTSSMVRRVIRRDLMTEEQTKQCNRMRDSGFFFQCWLADRGIRSRVQKPWLILDCRTGLPNGMTQAYFDIATTTHGKLGWIEGKLQL